MATYYISPTGNDSTGDGSTGTPWATISKAHTSASSGDTIICKAGTYTWVSQTFTKSLTIEGETGTATDVIFDAALGAILWTGSVNLQISDLSFINNRQNNYSFTNFNLTASNCRFVNCVNATSQDAFYRAIAQSTDVTVSGCLFYDVYNTAAPGTVQGIFRNTVAGSGKTITFTNNTYALTVTGVYIGNGFFVYGSQTGFTAIIKNNIFYSVLASVPVMSGALTGVTYDVGYNDYYNFTEGTHGGTVGSTGTITSDPLFVDAANGNFDLRPSSPCINSGTLI